jgi:hypothetical protein
MSTQTTKIVDKPDEDELMLRSLVVCEEDRHLVTARPYESGFRWFRSANVVCLEKHKRRPAVGGR